MTGDVHDRIRDYWDRDSDTYDETRSHAISDPLEASAWRQALADALPEPGSKVLDVGAGTGALAAAAERLRVTALDLPPELVRAELKAKERGLEDRMGSSSVRGRCARDLRPCWTAVLWTLPIRWGARACLEVSSGCAFDGGLGRPRNCRKTSRRVARRSCSCRRPPLPTRRCFPSSAARLPRVPLRRGYEAGWSSVRPSGASVREWAAKLHEPWPLVSPNSAPATPRPNADGAFHRRRVQNTSVRYGSRSSRRPPRSGSSRSARRPRTDARSVRPLEPARHVAHREHAIENAGPRGGRGTPGVVAAVRTAVSGGLPQRPDRYRGALRRPAVEDPVNVRTALASFAAFRSA